MEAVDEFEAEGDHQGDAEEKEGRGAFNDRAGRLDVIVNVVGGEQQAAANNGKKNNHGLHIDRVIELWGRTSGVLRGGING